MKQKIYFDNAATTQMRDEVYQEMLPYFVDMYSNASGIYSMALENRRAIDKAREQVAKVINASPKEIYFTGGGTEADNWAIKGIAEAYKEKGNHIITCAIEHHAVLHTCEHLEEKGYKVTYLPIYEDGIISLKDLEDAITSETILITIMFANNEIGTIQPIKEIGEIAKKHNITFHTDAVQAVGHVPIDVKDLNIDLLSMSGHKMYGPKGIGVLYIRNGVKIKPFIHGGAQERNRRAGTENVPGIVAFGKAIELLNEEMKEENERVTRLRNMAIDGILSAIPHSRLNGDRDRRLPGNLNISFRFIEGEGILLLLDHKGIIASSGSACTSGSLDASHVLLALGLPYDEAHGSLRITIGRYNTEEDITKLIEVLPNIISKLREMSPLYEEFINNK